MEPSPDILRHYLNSSIQKAAVLRSQYSTDIRNFSRNRKFDVKTVLTLLYGMNGGSLAKELHTAGITATPSAFVQQRAKIAPMALYDIMREFNGLCTDPLHYHGYRLLSVDGTTINLPFNPNADSFLSVATHPRGGYNAMHLTPLFDVLNNTFYDCIIQPQSKQDEAGALIRLLYQNRFSDKTLIIADRGFEGYNNFAHLIHCSDRVDFLVRIKQGNGAMREVKKLPMMELDRNIHFTLTTSQRKADKERGYILMQMSNNSGHKNRPRWDFSHINPFPMTFRVVRLMLPNGEFETLATSLPRNEFSIDDLKELYHLRWGIETSFRHLKYGIGLVNLHGKSDDFALQEIYAGLTMFNFCSRIARQAVIEQRRENVYEYRVNMTMAIQLCKTFFKTPHIHEKELLADLSRYVVPVRPGRQDERNLKTKSFSGFLYRVAA